MPGRAGLGRGHVFGSKPHLSAKRHWLGGLLRARVPNVRGSTLERFCSRIQAQGGLLQLVIVSWGYRATLLLSRGSWCFPMTHPGCGQCHFCAHFIGQFVTQLPICKAIEKYNFPAVWEGRRTGYWVLMPATSAIR